LTQNAALVTQVTSFLSPTNLFIITAIVVLIACMINLLPVKTMIRVLWACFIVGLFGIFVFAVVMITKGEQGFVATFNQLSGANYLGIIKSAQSAGYFTGFTLMGTVLGTMYACGNFLGFAYSIYPGGEVKQVNRSQAIGIFGSSVILALTTWLIYEVAYLSVGSEFMHAASYLALTGNSAWTLPMIPYLTYLVVFATSNPWLAIIPAVGLMFGALGNCITLVNMSTRMFFAYSFDRILPTRIADVDDRFHVPRNAVAVVFIVAIVFVYFTYFTPVLSYIAYSSIGLWVPQVIVGIAAMIFPYRRKDILEKAPSFVQRKFAGVPLLTILGAITVVISIFDTIVPVMPIYTGAPINPIYVAAIIITMCPAPIIYAIAWARNRRIGIDMSVGFRELPPA
jgi:APA family basic amino acid/polyamine antiporter